MTLVWSHYGNLAVFVYVVCVMNIQILLNTLHPCLSFIGDCSLQLRVFDVKRVCQNGEVTLWQIVYINAHF